MCYYIEYRRIQDLKSMCYYIDLKLCIFIDILVKNLIYVQNLDKMYWIQVNPYTNLDLD